MAPCSRSAVPRFPWKFNLFRLFRPICELPGLHRRVGAAMRTHQNQTGKKRTAVSAGQILRRNVGSNTSKAESAALACFPRLIAPPAHRAQDAADALIASVRRRDTLVCLGFFSPLLYEQRPQIENQEAQVVEGGPIET